ncbi:MAG: hypothetical protein NT038_09105 [Euryarchaeota archaeon]|nr:hypothetical protein [Euryarchaeota archaeon]
MKKILMLGSIVVVILLVLISFNSVITVQATRTTLTSQLKTIGTEKNNFRSLFLLLILFLLYESGFSIGDFQRLISSTAGLIFITLYFIYSFILYSIVFSLTFIIIVSAFAAGVGLYLYFIFALFFAKLTGQKITWPSGPN